MAVWPGDRTTDSRSKGTRTQPRRTNANEEQARRLLAIAAACSHAHRLRRQLDRDDIKENEERAAETGDCGDLTSQINPWIGYVANAYVVGHIAQEELGCTVNYKNLKEDVSWQGMAAARSTRHRGLGPPGPEKKFFADQGTQRD